MAAVLTPLPLKFVRDLREERWHFPDCKLAPKQERSKPGRGQWYPFPVENAYYAQQVSSPREWPIADLLASCCRDRYERLFER